jgi:DNA repair protein RadC
LKQICETTKVLEPTFYHVPIKEWPSDERPREKLVKRGAGNLTDAELLAILIRTGKKGATAVDLARHLLTEERTLRDISSMSVEKIRLSGIGESRAIAIVAAFELAKRLSEMKGKERLKIHSPEDIVRHFRPKLRDLVQEELWVLPLNAINQLLEPRQVSKGILNSSLAHPRECFREAITQSAAAVVFVHNHPSGNPEPSQDDLVVTKQLVDAGKIIGITVHDHIIIAGDRFTSLAERKIIL